MEIIFSKDNKLAYSYIAFFDLDHTITGAVSGTEMARRSFSDGYMSRIDYVRAIYLSVLYKLNLRDPQKIVEEMTSWVRGMTMESLAELSRNIIKEKLFPSVYTDAVSEIKAHKDKNAKVVLLSSALDTICREIAGELNLDDFICSSLEVENGYLTGRPLGRLCFGDEKRIRLSEYCNIHNASISDSWYYGDSISDLAALSTVGNPRCVNPDYKLRKAAKKRGWKILSWDS
jgi:HAD superfamily hydrolase (TIGR01490 family)